LTRLRRAAGAAVLSLVFSPASEIHAARPPRTYLVLPFEDTASEPSREWLREAMALSIGDYLFAAGLGVVDRENRLLATEELGLPAGAPLTLATSIRVGRFMHLRPEGPGPDRLVVGKFSLDQGHLSISARVLDLTASRAGPWRQEEGSLQDLIRVQKAVAHALLHGEKASPNTLGAVDDAEGSYTFPLVAYENHIRALIDPDPGRQQSLLRKAIHQSPGYPKASYHLAQLLAGRGKNREALSVLDRIAGEPAPYGAEYHALLGSLSLELGQFPRAEEEAQKSLSLRETAQARLLMAKIERSRGNSEAARRELGRAGALDPDNPEVESLRKLLQRDTDLSR